MHTGPERILEYYIARRYSRTQYHTHSWYSGPRIRPVPQMSEVLQDPVRPSTTLICGTPGPRTAGEGEVGGGWVMKRWVGRVEWSGGNELWGVG